MDKQGRRSKDDWASQIIRTARLLPEGMPRGDGRGRGCRSCNGERGAGSPPFLVSGSARLSGALLPHAVVAGD